MSVFHRQDIGLKLFTNMLDANGCSSTWDGTGVCTGVKRDTHLPDMVIDKGRMAHARLGTTRRQEI